MNSQTHMDQRIFEWGLPVETVSVYLLCTGLADAEKDLTLSVLQSVWNGDDATLTQSLAVLTEKGILATSSVNPECYRLESSDCWIR